MTIRKNTKKAREIIENASSVEVWTLYDGCYVPTTNKYAAEALKRRGATMYSNSDGSHTIHVHSNCFYRLR